MSQLPESWTYWLNKLSALKQGNNNAPHKPLLLLLLCERVEEHKTEGALLMCDGDLAFRFHSYWKIVADRRRSKPNLKLPFFYLRGDGVWKPLESDGREAQDKARASIAELETSLFIALQSADFRLLARRTLIARYFEPAERAELYALLGMEIPPDDIIAADASRFLPSDNDATRRDAKFSVRVLPAYDYTCVLLRFRMIAINGTTPLDAAHIHQFKRGGSNHPTNGLSLSKTAHWLFDRGFWSLDDDLKVIVNEKKFEESGDHAHLLKPRAGCQILLPSNNHFLPNPDCLRWHRIHHKFEAA